MISANQIFAALPNLTAVELKQLQLRLQLVLGSSPTHSDQDEWLLGGVIQSLRDQGIFAGKFKRNAFPKPFETLQVQQEWLIKGCNRKPSLHEQHLLAQLSGEVLVSYLKRIKLAPSLKLVLQNLHNLPIAFEYAYPGYWECKVLLCLTPTGKR